MLVNPLTTLNQTAPYFILTKHCYSIHTHSPVVLAEGMLRDGEGGEVAVTVMQETETKLEKIEI